MEGIIRYTIKETILVLAHHPKIGAKIILKLAEVKLLANILDSNSDELRQQGVPEKLLVYLNEANKYDLKELKTRLIKYDIGYVTFLDEAYSGLLSQIPDKPALLFYKGNLSLLKQRLISMVGSRKFTNYAKQVTIDLVSTLVASNLVVVSGLALGIDSIAHQAVLDNNGSTIAVLGNGLNTIYPASHAGLARKILSSGGLIISEFPPESEVYPGNFPMRNRIIAGLCEAVIIVEAGLRSGSLITARLALDYNREVMVVPHNWYIENGRGGNVLIREGASVINSPADILENLSLTPCLARKIKPELGSENEKLIYAQFSGNPIHIDEIIKVSGLPANIVGGTLTIMEMNGLVHHDGGNIYSQMI